jgi:hypothetical protein
LVNDGIALPKDPVFSTSGSVKADTKSQKLSKVPRFCAIGTVALAAMAWLADACSSATADERKERVPPPFLLIGYRAPGGLRQGPGLAA